MKKFIKMIIMMLCVFCFPSIANAESNDIDRITKYLNSLRNVSVGFVQITDQGGIQRGQIYIARPKNNDVKKTKQGKMRVEYELPNNDFIVADGTMIQFWDSLMETQSRVLQKDNLLGFILQTPIVFNNSIKVLNIENIAKTDTSKEQIAVTLTSAKDASAGSLTLVFDDNPLKLRQWIVLDANGITTTVSLYDMTEPETIPSHLFVFKVPETRRK